MTMTADEVARNFYESYNDRDLDKTYEQYVSRGLVNHAFGGEYDWGDWLATGRGLLASFKDLRVAVLDQIAQGDRVATRLSMSGTQTGEFHGIAPGDAVSTLTGTVLDRIEDGKIAEHWSDSDLGGFMPQLTPAEAWPRPLAGWTRLPSRPR
jgi:predicted ester cyclase